MSDALVYYTNLISAFILLCIGIPGNLLILHYFLIKCWKRLNSYYIFINYLAVTDLLVCFCRSFTVLTTSLSPNSTLADFVCQNSWNTPIGLSAASVLILCGLSFDRYRKITKPFTKDLPRRMIHFICLAPVFLAPVIYIPYNQQSQMDRETGICHSNKNPSYSLVVLTFTLHLLFLCIIPITLIFIFNWKIAKTLQHQHQANDIKQQDVLQRNTRAMRTIKWLTISASVTVFTPNVILTILYTACVVTNHMLIVTLEVLSVTRNLVFMNSAINVFVYWLRVKEFKEYYVGLFSLKDLQFKNNGRSRISKVQQPS